MIQSPPRTMLEVLEGLPEGTLCQLINNSLVMSPSPNFEHQLIAKKIFRQLDNYAEKNNAGEVIFAPMDVYFGKRNVFQPDILFIAKENLGIVQGGKVKGAPDLIIEILSPATAKYDLNDKKDIYEQFGVKEYWIVDPDAKFATGYKLAGKEYKAIESLKGKMTISLLNLTIRF